MSGKRHECLLHDARDVGVHRQAFGIGPRRGRVAVHRLGASVPAEVIEGLVDGDAIHPAVEPLGRIVAVEMLVNLEEDRLRQVPRLFAIANHAQGDVVDGALIPADQGLEPAFVSLAALADKLGVVVIRHTYTPAVERLARPTLTGPARTLPPRSGRSGRTRKSEKSREYAGSPGPGGGWPRWPTGAFGCAAGCPGPGWKCTGAVEIHVHRGLDSGQEGLRLVGLRRVEPARQRHAAFLTPADLEHRAYPSLFTSVVRPRRFS